MKQDKERKRGRDEIEEEEQGRSPKDLETTPTVVPNLVVCEYNDNKDFSNSISIFVFGTN